LFIEKSIGFFIGLAFYLVQENKYLLHLAHGGFVRDRFGYEYVFICGALIALINLISTSRIKIAQNPKATVVAE
jgi:hypothetical protein